jgi:hypothetical protein
MARANLRGAAVKGLALSLAILLAACNPRSDEDQTAQKRISSVTDDRYYIHPRVPANDRMVIKGCCTFEIAEAQVTQLPGDVDGRLIRGQGYQAELAFGTRLAALPPGFTRSGHRDLDGVTVTELKSGSQQYALQAIVPLSNQAAKKGIDFPQLQVVGRCETAKGCRELKRVLESIRF